MALAYYNEWDSYAAEWLRNLIGARLIAYGVVDERSICDVSPDDLRPFNQCHFFAGIGGWSLAAHLAGWPDDRALWSGSCPCQPFSVAGKQAAQADERHLWPELFRLVAARQPPVIMGEQVTAAVGKSWLDGVCTDLESIGYATGAATVPACAVDAPHRRDRLWFVADRDSAERRSIGASGHDDDDGSSTGRNESNCVATKRGALVSRAVVDSNGTGLQRRSVLSECRDERFVRAPGVANADSKFRHRAESHEARRLAEHTDRRARNSDVGVDHVAIESEGRIQRSGQQRGTQFDTPASNPRSAWHDSILVTGADGKARRVKPGVRLLANGIPARVGRLRAYGNAIVPQVAAEILAAYMECAP